MNKAWWLEGKCSGWGLEWEVESLATMQEAPGQA